ncbi:MAG: apiosidase-like domain-containing protein [Devosia sp.]
MTDQPETVLETKVHQAVEWHLASARDYADPWSEVEVMAIVTGDDGTSLSVPAFWGGGAKWTLRIAVPRAGRWSIRTECSEPGDSGLHGRLAVLNAEAVPDGEANALRRHGPVAMRADGQAFCHADGTPFYWLGDTWWMQSSERVAWPEDFGRLVDHRIRQGFTVAQIVLGFPPDTTPFDGRDANAGGSPWREGYASINPAFFDAVDRRLSTMIEAGLVPCILGSWGYHAMFMGAERMRAHWRYLVARYAAWPVIWCLAGEGAMPYYLSKDPAGETAALRALWPTIARQLRASDPYHRPITLHPRRNSWDDTEDPQSLDFFMIQPGHLPNAPQNALQSLAEGRARFPGKIIVNAEPPYEGHAGTNLADVQRYSFWTSMLSGAGGYTYGAAGIFQANDRRRPTGDRPDGGAYDAVFWDEALGFPGAQQVAQGHALLASLGYERFEPHPEWAEIRLRWGAEAYPVAPRAFAAGVPGEVRLVYLPVRFYHWDGPLVRDLEPDGEYEAAYINPISFERHEIGPVAASDGTWRGPTLPHMQDWLLLLTRRR